jgi:fructan beta-fructosidase
MSEQEKHRPALHFSPRRGWINDPNGMIRVDGSYHLFFQHDPDSITHGPMHWGHAVSTDLVHWTELPVALYPDALGTCFSGSAIETGDGGIKLFYTAHSRTPEGHPHQVQCLVHADHTLERFRSDPANPVLPNPGKRAFRDPKVIWHAPSGRWIMLVTEGQSIAFYASADFVNWDYLSSFGEGHGRHSEGPWECPDMVPLAAPDEETVWVLIVGLNPGGYAPGSGTQYFIGGFDGTRFVNSNRPETELWLDYGRDYYAAQTFFERRGAPPTAMAWASNWLYAKTTPTEAFRGQMSLPRVLRLVETRDGLRLAAGVPESVRDTFAANTDPAVTYRHFDIALRAGQSAEIRLFGEADPQFVIAHVDDGTGSIRTVRLAQGDMDRFAHDYHVDFPWPADGPLDIELYVDHGLVELGAADGLVWITNLYYPDETEVQAELIS